MIFINDISHNSLILHTGGLARVTVWQTDLFLECSGDWLLMPEIVDPNSMLQECGWFVGYWPVQCHS